MSNISWKYLRRLSLLFGVLAYILFAHIPLAHAAILITHYPIPTPFSNPASIVTGPDGNMWVTQSSSMLLKVTPSGVLTEYDLSTMQTAGIAVGPDGNLWTTQPGMSAIARVTTDGVFTNFSSGVGTNPYEIVAGPDGNLWFADTATHSIGKITTGGVVTEYPVVSNDSAPTGLVFGPDGNLWFLESQGDQICVMNTSGAISACYGLPEIGAGLSKIIVGPDNNLWFTENYGNKVGKITTAGVITEYSFPPGTQPLGIVAGPDGHIWVTEWVSLKITEMDTNGTILNRYDTPNNSYPQQIVVGPDNNLWFTEFNNIGKLSGLNVPMLGGGAGMPASELAANRLPLLAETGQQNSTLTIGVIFLSSTGLLVVILRWRNRVNTSQR